MEVVSQDAKVTEVAGRYGVSRTSVHSWIRKSWRFQPDGSPSEPD